jgi:hypothetical protein
MNIKTKTRTKKSKTAQAEEETLAFALYLLPSNIPSLFKHIALSYFNSFVFPIPTVFS